MNFSDVLTNVISGGVTGIAGAAISRYADYKNKQLDIEVQKLKFENEIQLRHIDERMLEKEWNVRDSIAVTEAESAMDIQDSKAFQAAVTSEPGLYHNPLKITKAQNAWMVFVDGVRGLIRPGLTLYLCLITTAVYMQAGTIIKMEPLGVENAVGIYTQISATVLYLTTTCVLFWFGARAKGTKTNG